MVMNHTETEPTEDDEGSGGGAEGAAFASKQQDKISGTASEAARKRLQELNDTPQYVDLIEPEKTFTDVKDRKRPKTKKGAKTGKTPKQPKRGKGGRFK
jgi:hypothetical protein